MFKKSFIVLSMMFLFFTATGQNYTDSIQEVKVSSGMRYEQSGHILKLRDLEYIMNDNQASTKYLGEAKTLNVFSNIISGSGGALIGYSIGYGLSSRYYFNMTMIFVGCGLVIISIPFSMACNNKMKMAVENYNRTFKSTGSVDRYGLKLGFTQNGIGLTFTL